MTYYDDIYEVAVDNHYLISTAQARDIGIPGVELAKLAGRGRLEHVGHGLYRLSRNVPSESDPYAVAVAIVGEEAYLWGESVIALLGLAPTDPSRMYVASPRRVRRKLPPGLRVLAADPSDKVTFYDGIRCQGVSNAIASARLSMTEGRLLDAAKHAREEGYLTGAQARELKEAMGWL